MSSLIGSVVPHPPTFRVSELPADAFPTLIVVFCALRG
jgi:hypothetical protein